MTSTRKTKAELQAIVRELEARLRGCEQENTILRENVDDIRKLNDAYHARLKTYTEARDGEVKLLGTLTDERTSARHRARKHREDSAKGGKAHEPLKGHKAALLKIYREQQSQGIKHPNKAQLTQNYIDDHPAQPELVGSFDRLRKSLPRRGE